jgi:peptidoglycan/LPS O-acetylase OafA/YrhL
MFVYSLVHSEASVKPLQISSVVALWLLVAFVGRFEFHMTARPFFWCEVFMLATLVASTVRWNLRSSALAFLGRLSYSIYLFHFAVLYFLEKEFGNRWPYWVGLPVALAVTVLVAQVSGATAEKWSQDAARMLIGIGRSGSPIRQLIPLRSRS